MAEDRIGERDALGERIDGTNRDRRPLHGHVSLETALVVEDYPYGFRLRCRIRYWLESHPKKGMRFVSQTTNPKIAHAEVWNKPKASTYALVGGMYLDHEGHVQWTALGMGTNPAEVAEFLASWPECRPMLADFIRVQRVMYTGYVRANREGLNGWSINGVPQKAREGELEENEATLDAWTKLGKDGAS